MLRQRKFNGESCKQKNAASGGRKTNAKIFSDISSVDIGWVGPITLKKRAKPALKNERYKDISVRLSIQEVKNLPSKGKYFCEICLDRILYARTTSKQSDGGVFWGEKFELHNLPEISIVTINLYKQGSGSGKEKRYRNKELNQFIAFVTIPLNDISKATEHQEWFKMQAQVHSPNSSQSECLHKSPPINEPHTIVSEVTSPNGSSFRKRSTPVSCFRYSTSSSPFTTSPEEPTESLRSSVKKKRSWTMGIGDAGCAGQNSRSGGKSMPVSSHVSPNCNSSKNGFNFSYEALPQIRVTVHYDTVDILPLMFYNDLRAFISIHSLPLLHCLQNNLSAKQKEELASCFVNIHEKVQEMSVARFLTELVSEELRHAGDDSILLRSNSIASKAIECYIKLVGSEYLHSVLKGPIEQLLSTTEEFEIDPSRLQRSDSNPVDQSQLERNRLSLLKSTCHIWKRIIDCISHVPYELREVFYSLRRRIEQTHGIKIAYHVISSCLFLRFICPAIHGPVLFGLASSVPESTRVSRNLTLVAKVLQTIANQTSFEEKELHMKSLNAFVDREIPVMRSFLDDISSVSLLEAEEEGPIYEDCHYYIDLGYEFAKLAQLLSKYTEQVLMPGELKDLPSILSHIREHTADNILSWCPTNSVTQTPKQFRVSNSSINGTQGETNGNCCFVQRPSMEGEHLSVDMKKLNSEVAPDNKGTIPMEKLPGQNGDILGENMTELLTNYQKQLRELNDCIERVEVGQFEDLSVLGAGAQQDPEKQLISISSDSMIGEEYMNGNEVMDASDYESGEHRYLSDCEKLQSCCNSEPVHIPTASSNPNKETFMSGSPSLDQLAERLQELKLLLKHERNELAQVVAKKTRAIQAQEQSIEQLASELNQLRNAPNGRFRAPAASKHSSTTVSPSSSFSSEYCASQQSDDHRPNKSSSGLMTANHRHQKSDCVGVQKSPNPVSNGTRSSSFISQRSSHSNHVDVKYHGRPNLIELTRTSEGTGIPLEQLVTRKQYNLSVRRRFSETNVVQK